MNVLWQTKVQFDLKKTRENNMVTSFATCLYRIGGRQTFAALVPPYLQQLLEYRLLERSGMNATETVDAEWMVAGSHHRLKKGEWSAFRQFSRVRFRCHFKSVFAVFDVSGCGFSWSFICGSFRFLPAFALVKHCWLYFIFTRVLRPYTFSTHSIV